MATRRLPLATLVTALLACAPEYDTRRVPAAQGTLGEEVFQVMCERVHWGETPRDLGFTAGRRPCTRGLGATEAAPGVGPRATALARMRSDLVAGLDQSMPRPLYTPLDRLLVDLLPLYGGDGTGRRGADAGTWIIDSPDGGTVVAEDLLPQTTRAVAQQLATMATDASVLRALGRMSQRQGYRPPESAIGLLRPILAYDRVDETLDATLGLIRQATPTQPDGLAYPQFNRVLAVLRGEFQNAGPSAATVGGTTLDAATDLFLRSDSGLARGDRPTLIVRRDAAGNALPASGTAAAGLPTPFPTYRGAAVARDAQGRATAAGGFPWRYVDLNATVLAALARELPALLGAPAHAEMPALQLMSGMRPLIGPRMASTRDYGAPAGRVDYQRFSADASPLIDLVHATGAVLTHRDVDPVLNTAQALMSPEREALTARLVAAMLAIDEASDRVPSARMDARSVIWDDVMDVVRRIAAEPGLLEDLLNALANLQQPLPSTGLWDQACAGTQPAQNLARAFSNYAQYRDRVEPAWSGNWNAHVAVNLSQPVDRSQPDTAGNRSVLQRLFHLVDDLNGAHLCNKPHAAIRVRATVLGQSLTIPVPGAGDIGACSLVEVPDAAAFYVRSIAGNGRAVLPLDIPGVVGSLADIARRFGISLDSTLDGLVQSQSTINGFNSQPSPYAIARLVFNPNPNAFLVDLMDVATVRNAGSPPPSPSPVDRQVRTLHPATIFAWEGYCFYDSIRPLAQAFARHDRLNGRLDPALSPGADPRTMDPRAIDVSNGSKLFTELLSAFHRHWATSAAGQYQSTTRCEACREGVNYSQMDGAMRYEPVVKAALDGDLLPALSSVAAELRTLDVGGGRTGLQSVAALTRALVDPRARAMDGTPAFATPLRYRTGTTGAVWSDGTTPVGGVTLFYLFADAFNGMDPRFAAEPDRHAEWLAARSSMVDQFLATEGSGASTRFRNRAIPGVTRALVGWLRERVAAHRAAGDADPWALGLSSRLETVVRDAPFAAATDLSLALRDDPAARVALGRLLTHMMDDAAPNARSASPQATTLSALAETVQVLRADADVDPLLHSLAPAMVPRTGLVPQVLRFFDRARALDRDRALVAVLGHAVERPATGDPLTPEPLTVIADAVADTNRERPGEHGPMSPQDVFFTFREVISFLTDNSRGLEQFYSIVQRRRLPQ
jgi:hypothetical protein